MEGLDFFSARFPLAAIQDFSSGRLPLAAIQDFISFAAIMKLPIVSILSIVGEVFDALFETEG